MSIEKYAMRERRARYKNIRKVRKARDIASKIAKDKNVPWKVSRVMVRFHADIHGSTLKRLAKLIYHYMPKNNAPIPPPRKTKV